MFLQAKFSALKHVKMETENLKSVINEITSVVPLQFSNFYESFEEIKDAAKTSHKVLFINFFVSYIMKSFDKLY